MKITKEDIDFQYDIVEIKSACAIGNYTIRISFNDGITQLIDFKPFLEAAQHPSIRKYLDINLFNKFKIIDGNLNWNDFDMIFPIEDLHSGIIK
jgi:hypothetical protein